MPPELGDVKSLDPSSEHLTQHVVSGLATMLVRRDEWMDDTDPRIASFLADPPTWLAIVDLYNSTAPEAHRAKGASILDPV
jgi:hypothetical protein